MLSLPFEAGSDSCGVRLRFVRSNESVPEGFKALYTGPTTGPGRAPTSA